MRIPKMRANRNVIFSACVLISLLVLLVRVYATPVGPTTTYVTNSTNANPGNATLNYSGGYIVTYNFVSNEQNTRWKAFVGNVSGTLKLADADSYSIFEWSRATTSGEVYATRTPNTISWSNINCSTAVNKSTEEIAIGHTANPNDNLSATFNDTDNKEFYVGTEHFQASNCSTINLNVNNTRDAVDDFEEISLHDGTYMIYAAIVENDKFGYTNINRTYDFQIMVPENVTTGATQLAYYFYVELT